MDQFFMGLLWGVATAAVVLAMKWRCYRRWRIEGDGSSLPYLLSGVGIWTLVMLVILFREGGWLLGGMLIGVIAVLWADNAIANAVRHRRRRIRP